ncbi:MAG: SGNH/GDSL hydrolase family protein [Spirochaetales bacterium]|nr:SGNH/GDSL hydrolase family protein [Spirochaetales bacterium]
MIHILGDSLTAGNLGIPYTGFLAPHYAVSIDGKDGDTLLGALDRFQAHQEPKDTQILVVEIGANDVLLPHVGSRSSEWAQAVGAMIDSGSRPTPQPQQFAFFYKQLLNKAQERGYQLVLLTIPPLGENLALPPNPQRMVLNHQIRILSQRPNTVLVDVALEFEKQLQRREQASDWLFPHPQDFILDKRRMRREGGTAKLCQERQLLLTMDGAHLNETGAKIMGNLLSEGIEKILRITSSH